MCCCEKIKEKLAKLSIVDMGVMKICLFAFAFLVAKLWPVVLTLPIAFYAAVFALTYAYLLYFFFIKK